MSRPLLGVGSAILGGVKGVSPPLFGCGFRPLVVFVFWPRPILGVVVPAVLVVLICVGGGRVGMPVWNKKCQCQGQCLDVVSVQTCVFRNLCFIYSQFYLPLGCT